MGKIYLENTPLQSYIAFIYLNITGNVPIINTLLICNENTNIEEIKAFLYRAIFCDKPILFLIANIECLELHITQNIIKTLKSLYKLRNNVLNSYLVIIYEKVDSGLARDIEKLIPEKNILNNIFLKQSENKDVTLENIELFASKFSGYGKTTEIIYKVKEKRGEYHYLPIGGSFTREFVINNLSNLNLNFHKAKKTYIHIDLSDTDDDDLMNEILFKLIILRYVNSNETIFYLGYDINLIIEIPKGFVDYEQKYKLLTLFKKTNIVKLCPLRLEENVKYIKDSPISIVAEVLSLYDNNEIRQKNIDLDGEITKTAEECEKIINRHFKVDNQNYYQKMNFIKILSVQFKKFTECFYFKYEVAVENENEKLIAKLRVEVIKNFIELTKVFTQSPFDTVLLKQIESMNLFGKYDENKAIEEGVMALADDKEKKRIFSFEQIKPSLVFFNEDGYSLSIITNNNKNDQEYKNLKALWNSQKRKNEKLEELVDYKNMKHEDFLLQIKKLFALDSMEIDDLKKLCENLGNYIFVSDNFIKMVRILLNIEAKIPVILMGETGVGKTKLLEMLATLYGKGTLRWERLQIHAGTTDQKIVSFIDKVHEKVKKEGAEDKITWIFFDEINTCNSLGLITEIMCNHTYLGKKINKNFVFLGACNPYRILTKKMRTSGLVYYNMKETTKLNNLVYTVNPLPHALLNFVFDFASLQPQDEKKYITNTITSILTRIKRDKLIEDVNENDLNKLTDEIIESIVICHDFIREKYDKSSVSMREIRRFGIFFEYFIKHFKYIDSTYLKMKTSLNMTLYLCYYLRLNDKDYRKELAEKLNKFYVDSNFLKAPENEIKRITKEMSIEKGKGIALNRALRENLFTCYICIDNNVPLIIVGKPGTGKSLSFQILYNTLKGEYSDSQMFRDKGKLYRYYYQGSETSTAEGIEQVFEKALKAQQKHKENKNIKENKIITLVFFDEMGLAERSSNNPLKVIHYLLERDREDSVPFLGISNWRLDAAKINRALNLTITDYDIHDLEETAISIAESLDIELSERYKDFFETLARTYNEYIISNQKNIKENKDFHGNRDFYNLIKTAMRELMERRKELSKNEKKILTEVAILCLNRNFGGLEDSSSKIKKIFKKEYGHKFDEDIDIEGNFSVLDAITKNILDSNSRYLMLISEGNDGNDIIKYLLDSCGKKYIELVGSKYKIDIKSNRYSEEILNKIKYIMEIDNVLILKDLNMIYASLYDLFNQNFTCMGNKRFARIAFEYAKISSEVNKDFHAIVIVNKNEIDNLKLDPPFLNRFEKHIVNFKMLLEKREIDIAQKLYEYIYLISSFNEEKKLKIDLEKLLINCKLHNIEGLIFKIKNDENNELNENLELLKDENYEKNIIKKILNKIVPTFCQDIIASMMSCKLDQKYKEMNETVIEIYKNSLCNNLEEFLKKIESKRNIIYTFSKITEDLFTEKYEIENKFGLFSKQSFQVETIESIKMESELIYILKSFINEENKKLLIFRFSENDLNKMNSVNYIIKNFEKENPVLSEKLIIFIVHKQRFSIGAKLKKKIIPDLISFIDDEYYQIFIDNLQGRENLDIFKILQKKEELAKEYIDNNDFIDNKIFTVLNYLKYKIIFETKTLNKKNYTSEMTEKIINNKTIKELIIKNLRLQGKSIKGIIKDVFTNDIIEVNDVDFFEVINTRLSTYFISYLLNIIYYSLSKNILNQILNTRHFDLLFQDEYFNNLITSTFEVNKFKFKKPIKMEVNANEIIIYNELEIPDSKSNFDKLIKYVNEEICSRYFKNEELLRKQYSKEEKIIEVTKQFYKNKERFIENIKIELNKYELFKAILNQKNDELTKILFDEYLKYFVIKYLEKNQVNYSFNENILSFVKLLVKIRLSDNQDCDYIFENTIDEFIKIILFTQGYNDDIKNLLDTFIEVQKFCPNLEEYIINVLKEEIIKYEISGRNKNYTKIVNVNLFVIIEALIRGILLFSIDLMKNDKAKFCSFFYSFTSIEANLQKINKKFYLYSKEITNLRNIIKIEEAYKYNHEQFDKNYQKFINNLLQQSLLLYNNNYNNLYNVIIDLNNIIDQSFKNKNEEYINLLFFLFRQQYKNIYNEEIRIKLVENFFQNKLLIKKSKIFLTDTLKIVKPEAFNEKNPKTEEELIKNFMNLSENKKLEKYKKLIEIFNKIESQEFNELLLYFFEGQCQSYFETILKKYNYQYTEKSCEELILKLSLSYLKKAIKYLYEHINNNDNNILKFYAIAYLKIYFYYYVEINYAHKELCNFDEINKLLNDKDENNQSINSMRNMRNIYIWRVYCKKFENFEQFKKFDFTNKDIPIINELKEILSKKEEQVQKDYIFKNSFISEKYLPFYKKIAQQIEDFAWSPENNIEINFEEVNNNFDSFYCILINKIISYLYSNDKDKIKEKLKYIYDISSDKINFEEEGKKLYENLLNYNLLQNNIIKKISETPLNQEEFEILLYSLRFIFNTQINKNKSFYNDLLKKDTDQFIKNNYIPGTFPIINEYIKSYNYLIEALPLKLDIGYYICKDCGFLYEIPRCTFPYYNVNKCPNGHTIGGEDHVLSKLDLRIFLDENTYEHFKTSYDWPYKNYKKWHDSFVPKTLEDFKKEYVNQYLYKKEKGIINGFEINNFEKNSPVRELNNITFRILNFILYSYLMGSYILNNLSKDEINNYLVENLFPHTLFGIIKKNWELLNINLKKIGIDNIQTFLNIVFDKIIELMNNLKFVDTVEKLDIFENSINDYILEIINNKENIEKINKDYQSLNNSLLNFKPESIKEIIQGNYSPLLYDQSKYPDIQYYSVSNIQNYNSFVNKFKSSEENKKKYSLINLLINKELEITENAINMKSLSNINNLENLLLNIYSFKISREDAKTKHLNNELTYIKDMYNEINPIKIEDEKLFIDDFINPFIKSWDNIKKKSIQYKCRNLEKPLDMKIENSLSNFLVDDGDKEGGMFLASAYENLISWQNIFINEIISKNGMKGILNSYVSKLEQEIFIQDASKDEIINIDDNTYNSLKDLISTYSMRNIFTENNEINYLNYNDIKYDYDLIEEELGKIILPGLKKFKNNQIKFITYLYEGFRGGNSTILVDYNFKYAQRELSDIEKESLFELLQNNQQSKFINDVFASLQILMNEIVKENYEQNYLIYKVIESLPTYIILNNELVQLFKRKYEYYIDMPDLKVFTINTLVSIFEYFESLCWNNMKKNIPPDYQLDISEDNKKYILEYFEGIKDKKTLINQKNFTTALRRLISRTFIGTRQEAEIKFDSALKLYIYREDLWPTGFIDNDLFDVEIILICKDDILICNCWALYNLLEGDTMIDVIKKKDDRKNKENNIDIFKRDNKDEILNDPNNKDIINDIINYDGDGTEVISDGESEEKEEC